MGTGSRCDGACDRAGEPNVTFCGDGGARERADGLLSCRRQKNKSEQRPFCSDVSRGSEKRCGFDASDETKEKAEPGCELRPGSACKEVTKKILAKNFEIDSNPQKVGSKSERCERIYKRAAQAQRDLLRKRRSKEAGG